MVRLNAVPQHGSVNLLEHVRPDLDDQIRADPQDVRVVRRVVHLAQRQPVRHHRVTVLVRIRGDVCGVQKIAVPERADGAARGVGAHDPRPERGLVKALPSGAFHVGPQDGVRLMPYVDLPLILAPGHDELLIGRFFRQEVHGVDRGVDALGDAVEPNHRELAVHRGAQGAILGVTRVCAPPFVAEQLVDADPVLVRPSCALAPVDRADRQRRHHSGRFANAPLQIHERQPDSCKFKFGELFLGPRLDPVRPLAVKPRERGKSDGELGFDHAFRHGSELPLRDPRNQGDGLRGCQGS